MQHTHQVTRSNRVNIVGVPIALVGGLLLVALAAVGFPTTQAWWLTWWQPLVLSCIASIGVYLLPGLVLLDWLGRDFELERGVRIGLAVGISVSMPPLLLEIAHLIRLPWAGLMTWLYVIAAGAYLWFRLRRSERRFQPVALSWISVITFGLVLVGFFVRLVAIRELVVPMWSDSVHHTLIAQLLVDNQGLFDSWAPYAELQSLTYHFGFHANVAFMHWLTQLPVHICVLLVGQIMSMWSVVSVYTLTRYSTGSRTAGLWAVFFTGLINIDPAFYVNWGRYTQLTGHIVLLTFLCLALMIFSQPQWNWRGVALTAVILASQILTHYIVMLWALICGGVLILVVLARYAQPQRAVRLLIKSIVLGSSALILALPWLLNVLQSRIVALATGYATGRVGAAAINEATALGPLIPQHIQAPIMALIPVGLFIALIYRRWYVILCFVWAIVLYLSIIADYFGVPLRGIITGFAVAIGLYNFFIPVAAYAMGVIQEQAFGLFQRFQLRRVWVDRIGRMGVAAAVAGLLVGGTWWASSWQAFIHDPTTQLITQADLQAMQWIEDHTAQDAMFLVSTFFLYSDKSVLSDDGGAWIPYFTQRRITVPPLVYGNEIGPLPQYPLVVLKFANTLRAHPLPHPTSIEYLRNHGVDYIYVGALHRQTSQHVLHDYAAMRTRPDIFPVVYEQDGVVIFGLEPKS